MPYANVRTTDLGQFLPAAQSSAVVAQNPRILVTAPTQVEPAVEQPSPSDSTGALSSPEQIAYYLGMPWTYVLSLPEFVALTGGLSVESALALALILNGAIALALLFALGVL